MEIKLIYLYIYLKQEYFSEKKHKDAFLAGEL